MSARQMPWNLNTWCSYALACGHVLAACFCVPYCRAELPLSLPDSGSLLSTAPLIPGVQVGVYGPRFVTANEPALLGILIAGDTQTNIEYGFALIAAPDEQVDFTQAPAPSGAYLACQQSDPSHTQWVPLLNTGATGLWSMRVLSMAHPRFRLGAGAILDTTVLSSHLPQPERGSVFRTVSDRGRKDYDSLCVAFVTDERVGSAVPGSSQPASGTGPFGATQAIRLSFPLEFDRPSVEVSFWLALTINARPIAQGLTVSIGANRSQTTPDASASDLPILTSPTPDATVDGSVAVVGKTRPGTLAVAWLQWAAPHEGSFPTSVPTQRRITDHEGKFHLRLPVPPPPSPSATTISLHVRAEAPGYQTQSIIIPLRVTGPR